ncbi:M15 family metallopeptidase [Streptomyces sp. NPDC090022]|uniref:M15 family metallopeptidase n=1 Tax=Streptomyces sp. NPDC090022 TaxID=3365920 RepID=UPI0038082788
MTAVAGVVLAGALAGGGTGTGPAGPVPGGGGGAAEKAPVTFVALREVDPTVRQDMRYATARNVTGRVVDGYDEPVCLLTRPAAEALRRAQHGLLRQGYALTVYDCYRPQRAVDRFVRWARDEHDQTTKPSYYPHVDKSSLIPDGYIAEKSGHSRGSTVDVGLVRLPDRPVDMGTSFDFFDPLSHTDHPATAPQPRRHRDLLRRSLGEQGFVNLPEEWWHFTYRPEVHPGTYFDFPVRSAAVRP